MSASDFWNERYQTKDYLFGVEPNDFIRAVTPPAHQNATAFAPADGEGRNGVFLAKQGYHVTSVDVSNLAVDKAQSLAAKHSVNINSHVGDIFEFPCPDDHYDIVVICFMHFLPDDHDRFMSLMKSCLKSGGMIIIEGYSKDQIDLASGGPKNEDMLFSRDGLTKNFSDFDILLMQETRRNLSEGPRHQGEAATIQLIARKP